jgi:hypothetical protein
MPKASRETASRVEDTHAPPGHIPVITAGTEIVEFSPTAEYGRTMQVIGRNLAAMRTSA